MLNDAYQCRQAPYGVDMQRSFVFAIVSVLSLALTACAASSEEGTDSRDGSPVPLTIEEAKRESTRIIEMLAAEIPKDKWAEDGLLGPSEEKRAPTACGQDEYGYFDLAAIFLVEGTDATATVQLLEKRLRDDGWEELDTPAGPQPNSFIFENKAGYVVSIKSIDVDAPKVMIRVDSPCGVALPEGADPSTFKI